MLEVRSRVGRADRHELPGRLAELEDVVHKIRRANVGRSQARQRPIILDESYDAAELVLRVGDVAAFRIRRDDDEGNAKTEPAETARSGRRDVIVPSAPVIPNDQDCRAVPGGTLPDGIYELRHP